MKNSNIYNAYCFVIPILIIGLSLGYTSFLLSLVALLPLLFLVDRHSVGFFLLMYGGPLGGVIREMYPSVPIYGLILQVIGIFLMWDLVIDLIQKNARAIWGVIGVLLLFGFFYFIGPKDEFANNKYMVMIIHGTLMVLGYYAFNRSSKINVEGLCQILFVSTICMFAFCIDKYKIIPGGIADYNWFRTQCLQHYGKYATGEPMLISYQPIGMMALFAVAIYLSQVKMNLGKALFYTMCAFQLTMVSGARQAIFGVFVVIALRLVVFRAANIDNKHFFKKLLLSSIGLVVVFAVMFLYMSRLSSDVVVDTVSEGDDGRQLLYLEALAIFRNSPILGAGIGGFNAITDDGWPHNFILELLCETGMVGTGLFVLIVAYSLYKRKAGLMHITSTGQFYFLFLAALFVRVMVSSDLSESIELFSAVFALSSSQLLVNKRKKIRATYNEILAH